MAEQIYSKKYSEYSDVKFAKGEIGEIVEATYGNTNIFMSNPGTWFSGSSGVKVSYVTEQVKKYLNKDGSLYFQVNNDTLGPDPCPYTKKTFTLKYKKWVDKEETLDELCEDDVYEQGKYAVYIAIDEYENYDNLNSCVNDAKKMEKELTKQGFITLNNDIMCNQQVTKENIEMFFDKIITFLKDKKHSCFILYIAGHGQDINGRNPSFLCHNYDKNNSLSTSISYETINNYSKMFSSKHQLFIMDSCYSGSLIKYKTREGAWKKSYTHSYGIHGISSVQTYGKAIEGTNGGIFTECFINTLHNLLENNDKVRISEVFNKLIPNIKNELVKFGVDNLAKYTPKFGRLYNEITRRREYVNGEIIFFRNTGQRFNFKLRDANDTMFAKIKW